MPPFLGMDMIQGQLISSFQSGMGVGENIEGENLEKGSEKEKEGKEERDRGLVGLQ